MRDLGTPITIDDGLIQDLCDSMGDDDELYDWLEGVRVKFLTVADMKCRLAKSCLAAINVYEINKYCYAEVSDTTVTFISERKFSIESTSQFKYGVAVVRELELGGVSVNINNKGTFESCSCNILLDKSRVCIQNGNDTHGTFSSCYANIIDISNLKCDKELDIGEIFLETEIEELMADNCEITVNKCKDALRDYTGDIVSFRNCKARINCDFTEAIDNTWIDILDVSRTIIEFDDTDWDKSGYVGEESKVRSVIANDTVVNNVDKFMKILECAGVLEFETNVNELELAWNRLKGIER